VQKRADSLLGAALRYSQCHADLGNSLVQDVVGCEQSDAPEEQIRVMSLGCYLAKTIRDHRYGDSDRGHVAGVDNGDQARQNEHAEVTIAGRPGRLGCQPAPSEGAGQAVADLDQHRSIVWRLCLAHDPNIAGAPTQTRDFDSIRHSRIQRLLGWRLP